MRGILKTLLILATVLGVLYAFRLMRSPPEGPVAPEVQHDAYEEVLPLYARARIGRRPDRRVGERIAFTEDGSRVVSAHTDGWVTGVDTTTGEVAHRIRFHDAGTQYMYIRTGRVLDEIFDEHRWQPPIQHVAVSPDGRRVAAVVQTNVQVWDVVTGQRQRSWNNLSHQAWDLAFSQDGTRLVSTQGMSFAGGNWRNTPSALVLEVNSGKELARIEHPQPVACQLSADGGTVALHGSKLSVVDVASGEELVATPKREFGNASLALSADGRRVASVEQDNLKAKPRLVVRNARTGAELWTLADVARKRPAFSPDGSMLAVPGSGVRVFDSANGDLVTEIADADGRGFQAVTFSHDGTRLAASCRGYLRVWDTSTWASTCAAPPPVVPPGERISDFAFSRDSRWLVTVGPSGVAHVWATQKGRLLRTLTPKGKTDVGKSVAFSGSGRLVLVRHGSGMVRIWDHTASKVFAEYGKTGAGAQDRFAFVGERPVLVTGRSEGGLVAQFLDGDDAITLPVEGGAAISPVVNALGTTVVAGSGNGYRVWDLAQGTLRERVRLPPANHVALSPDGQALAHHAGGPLSVYDVTRGARNFQVHAWSGSSDIPLAVSCRGRLLAFGGQGPAIELWEVSSESRAIRFEGHEGRILSLRFSPDGRTLASSCTDGTILLWDVRPFLPAEER